MYRCLLLVGSSYACTSKFFCAGPILDRIQTCPYMTDGKYFVDMASARPEADILEDFADMPLKPDREDLKRFLDKNFHVPGYELDTIILKDYPPPPAFLKDIPDERISGFGEYIHDFWGTLVRKYNGSKLCEGCQSSLIEMDYPFIIPGGRFREFYYWTHSLFLRGSISVGSRNLAKAC